MHRKGSSKLLEVLRCQLPIFYTRRKFAELVDYVDGGRIPGRKGQFWRWLRLYQGLRHTWISEVALVKVAYSLLQEDRPCLLDPGRSRRRLQTRTWLAPVTNHVDVVDLTGITI